MTSQLINSILSNPNLNLLSKFQVMSDNHGIQLPFNVNSKLENYLSIDDFTNQLSESSGIKMININVRSLNANFESLKPIINSIMDLDIITLQEIWGVNKQNEHLFMIDGYSFFYLPRCKRRGGGVGIYVKDTLNPMRIDSLDYMIENIMEALAIECNVGNEKIIISSVYHSGNLAPGLPTNYFEYFCNYMNDYLDALLEKSKNILLGYDLNVNLLKMDASKAESVLNIFNSYGLNINYFLPTRVGNLRNPTIIDGILTSANLTILKTFQTVNSISDHNIQGICLSNFNHTHDSECKHDCILTRKWTKKKIIKIQDELWQQTWYDVTSLYNVNQAVDQFEKTFFSIIDKHVPLSGNDVKKKVGTNSDCKFKLSKVTYFNQYLHNLQKNMMDAEAKYKRTGCLFDHNAMINARNLFSKERKIARNEFYHAKFEDSFA